LDHDHAPHQPRCADQDDPPGIWFADGLLSSIIGKPVTLERFDAKCFKAWGDLESEVEIWVPVKHRE
jgi:hypothetical protein